MARGNYLYLNPFPTFSTVSTMQFKNELNLKENQLYIPVNPEIFRLDQTLRKLYIFIKDQFCGAKILICSTEHMMKFYQITEV